MFVQCTFQYHTKPNRTKSHNIKLFKEGIRSLIRTFEEKRLVRCRLRNFAIYIQAMIATPGNIRRHRCSVLLRTYGNLLRFPGLI